MDSVPLLILKAFSLQSVNALEAIVLLQFLKIQMGGYAQPLLV